MKTLKKKSYFIIILFSIFFIMLSLYIMYHYFVPAGKLNNVRLQKNIMDSQNAKLPLQTKEDIQKIKSNLEYVGLTDNNLKVLYPKKQSPFLFGGKYKDFHEIYSMGKGEIYKYKNDYFLKADRILFNFYDYLASTPRVLNQGVYYTDGYEHRKYPRYDYYRIIIKEQSLSDFDIDKLVYVGEYVDNKISYPLFYHNITGSFYCAKIGNVIDGEYNRDAKILKIEGINTLKHHVPKPIPLKKSSDFENRRKILSRAYAKKSSNDKRYILLSAKDGSDYIKLDNSINVKEYMVGFYSEVKKKGVTVAYKYDSLSEYNFASYYIIARKMVDMDLKVTENPQY